MVMRGRVVWAVALRDLRRVRGGRGRWSMLGLALALVVPLASVPCGGGPASSALPSPRRVVSGTLPDALSGVAVVEESARLHIELGPPLTVAPGGGGVPPWLREPLDRAVEPTVSLRREVRPVWLPKRNLWVLLLAASLLTGPLVESIPGERAQRTWETLRASACTSVELVTGKWLAWTLSATLIAACGVLAGVASGAQTLDIGLLGIPLVLGTVVALGLALVHDVSDPAGAATIPVRVIPLVLVGAALLAVAVEPSHPVLASLVPVGSPLLLAAGFPGLSDGGWGALLSSVLAVVAMLRWTAHRVEADGRSTGRSSGRGLVLVGTLAGVWWASVLGPQLWSLAGSSLRPSEHLPTLAGTAGLALVAAIAHLRGPSTDSPEQGPLRQLWLPLLGGAALGLMEWTARRWLGASSPELALDPGLRDALLGRPPSSAGLAVIAALGQELAFRGALTRQLGPVATAVAWVLVTRPLDPVLGGLGAAGLAWCYARWGLRGSGVAHVAWVAALALLR